ncbi:hypothetical protein PoB_004271200 [Plakobranchus ocellatus]|uniref:Uncharacterized protein n=1 Tax=Plakobranchus ocellatus TaxID=259542 RepID=A0AAV4B9W0_9GAST|nr:hypothetical protein PoB_004271200 [Plakobranchus ocellatus]
MCFSTKFTELWSVRYQKKKTKPKKTKIYVSSECLETERWRLEGALHGIKLTRGVGGSVASESALRSAGTRLSRVRTPPPASWPDGGPESLRSLCCELAIYKNKLFSAKFHPTPTFYHKINCTRFSKMGIELQISRSTQNLRIRVSTKPLSFPPVT